MGSLSRTRSEADAIDMCSRETRGGGAGDRAASGRRAEGSHDHDAMSAPREDAADAAPASGRPDLTEVILVLDEERIVTKATAAGGLAPPSLSGSLSGSRSMLAGPGPGPSKLVHDFTCRSDAEPAPRAHCHRHIDTVFVVVVLLAMLVLVIAECVSMKRF
ncbi:uncharacterized protein LOC113206971 [Frankliniella occidentalis]|uniref:Uncharacterized protein LOC113206971 n=1 Tax=Frankliniella occidentalis TaxID=133901 RepID=A0A6J1SIA0_FRAOC|nr:uncharacterized protein LOC113206971 [Frankliniella occidentalis]